MALRVIKPKDTIQNDQVVEYLIEFLDRAKKGEIVEMLATFKLSTGEYENCWTGSQDLIGLAGQLARQTQLTLRRMDT